MWKNFILIGLPLLLAQTPAVPLEFSAACSPPAHQRFIQGIVKLHNSAFREAGEHFRAAQQIDGDCVMAYWGEAMASSGEQDIAGGRRALLKLGPARAARAAKAASARERGYLNAVEVLLGEGDRNTRDFRYAGVMQKLAFDNPLDYEASAFYAAAIIATFRIGDPDLSKRNAAGSILELILKKYPDHPGALHSFIHAYDHPELAHHALDAARHYEKVAGEDFHALHTPAHAYVQLGMWADAVRANEAAFEVSRRYVQRNKLSVARLDYHSLEWLQYAELQSGMYQRAMSRTDMVLKSAAETRVTGMTVLAAEMASRFAVETAQWDALAPFSQNLKIPKLLFAQ
ncbi:MAG: hypothetical protein HY646_00295, partial [Acidobacteria bacterium]|nr:hypothetical protein [Acidobacteriota bacterium]